MHNNAVYTPKETEYFIEYSQGVFIEWSVRSCTLPVEEVSLNTSLFKNQECQNDL